MNLKFTLTAMLLILIISAQSQVPTPRYGHSVVLSGTDSCYYIFGGYAQNTSKSITSNGAPLNDLYKYNPKTLTFTKINYPEAIPGTAGHNAIYTSDGKMVILGGTRSAISDNSIYAYDLQNTSWEQIQNQNGPPAGRHSAGTTKYSDGMVYYTGGKNSDGSVSDVSYKYDPQSKTFSAIPNMPQGGRWGHKMFATYSNAYQGPRILVYGGRNANGEQSQMFEFDPSTQSWNFFDPNGMPPSARTYQINEILPNDLAVNEMWVAGGETQSTSKSTQSTTLLTDIWKLDLSQNPARWIKKSDNLVPVTQGVGWLTIEQNDTLLYTFGGISSISTNGDTTFTNNFYRYNITDNLVQQYDTTQQTWGGILSINEAKFDKNINLQIYPNPATSEINLAIPNNESIVSIKIYNQNGQLVKQIFKPNAEKINISDLKTGIYFIRTDTDTNRYLSKMIKD